MPRQISTIQIRGKHNGQSFYTIKGKTGGFMRNINQAMSERVKTEENFANTRRYASEFGHVQEWLRAYSWEAQINELRSGKKTLRSMIAERLLSTLHHMTDAPVGQRVLPETGWQKPIETLINNSQTKKISQDFLSALSVDWWYESEGGSVTVDIKLNTEADMFGEWRCKGADYMSVRMEGVNLQCASYSAETDTEYWGFNPVTGLYAPVQRRYHKLFYGFVPLGSKQFVGSEYTFSPEPETVTHSGGYTWDAKESTFFVKMVVFPTRGVRPNAQRIAGEGFTILFPFMQNFNV